MEAHEIHRFFGHFIAPVVVTVCLRSLEIDFFRVCDTWGHCFRILHDLGDAWEAQVVVYLESGSNVITRGTTQNYTKSFCVLYGLAGALALICETLLGVYRRIMKSIDSREKITRTWAHGMRCISYQRVTILNQRWQRHALPQLPDSRTGGH